MGCGSDATDTVIHTIKAIGQRILRCQQGILVGNLWIVPIGDQRLNRLLGILRLILQCSQLAGNTAGMELNAYATKSILGEKI